MDCYALTRALVDLDSTTGKEKPVVDYLLRASVPAFGAAQRPLGTHERGA